MSKIRIAEESRFDNTLIENFKERVMCDQMIENGLLDKIKERNAEKARKEKERLERERRKLINYLFPTNALSAMCHCGFSEEDYERINQIIKEELPNVKHYVDDKEKLIDIIIYLYKGKDYLERIMPYPESRYDACRAFLEKFDVDYLNIVLKETASEIEMMIDHVEHLINSDTFELKRK